MFEFLDEAARTVGGTFAGRDWSAPSAEQPQESTPADAGPLGFLGSVGQTIGDFGRGVAQEGLGAVLDPTGAIDRQEAQRELASQFNVIAAEDAICTPDGADPAPNTVTQEEFQRIARTYSDIRLDRSDIRFNTDGMTEDEARDFRSASMGDIGNLLQTESGRDLIGGLAYQPDDHTTTINLRADNSNAEGGADDHAAPGSWADGHGTNAEIDYVPGDAGGIVQPTMEDEWLPMRSDVTLFHELTHAHHAAYGTMDQTTLDGTNAHADDVGQAGLEYQAVGLGDFAGDHLTENTYRAERAAIGRSGVGARTTGGVSDVDMPQRDTYVWHEPPASGP